jgi:23S rRNA (cytosine1962-C5)-methyltransferase
MGNHFLPELIENYELLDFGDGRKLERFDPVVLIRPCPTVAALPKARPAWWKEATARFSGEARFDNDFHLGWTTRLEHWVPANWHFTFASAGLNFKLNLSPSCTGQVGLFPEQRENWEWIIQQVLRARSDAAAIAPPRVLNLFAYTGGSTLAAAVAGAAVVHIDASVISVLSAKMNAERSNLADRPIRWIQEDAMKFCRRELKRGNRYDAVILDPPSYGHGRRGEPWKIDRDLLPLLKLCGELTEGRPSFVLATCHTPGIGPAELAAYVSEGIFGHCGQPPNAGDLFLKTSDGRRLPSGVFARWPM